MALHALWDDQYAFSVRKGPIDWTDKTTGETDGDPTDAVSHLDDGTPTQNTTADTPAIQLGGSAHFAPTRGAAITTGTGNAAAGVISKGRHIGIPTSGTAVIHGIPVSGNPDFSVGTEIIETTVADGTVVGRVGGGAATNDGSSIFRGGSSPTFSMECVPTNMQLMLLGSTFFQEGTSQGLAAGADKGKLQLRTVADEQVSDPLYVGAFLKKMSASAADSRVLSDCCPTSFSLSADRSTPLSLSMDFTGRILVTDYNAGTDAKTTASDGDDAADTTLDIGRNYAMHDCIATISEGTSTTQYVMPVDSFSLSGSMETGYTFYNQPTPQSILTGPQSWEGSITIPLAGRGTAGSEKATNQTMTKLMAQVGMTGSTPSGTVNPIHISLFWEAQNPISAAFGAAATLPSSRSEADKVKNDRDLHIRMTCVITDISVGGDAEATQTISFRCLNQMTNSTTVAAYAVSIDTKAPASSGTNYESIFGFSNTTVTY